MVNGTDKHFAREKEEYSMDYKMMHGDIIAKMSLEEKALMMSGRDTWSTVPFEKYGIPAMFLSDGPHGLRKQAGAADHLGLNASLPATCFPTAATVANSWDETIGEELGRCLGEEAVSLGVNVVLGPGLNIKRSPLCGRNFEYFSEDPYLAGKMAAAYVRGIQSQGVSACPKHFAVNSQELRRMSSDSVVDERTFRELYTTGFEIAVKEGKAKSIMSSYNQINGVYANENEHLLREILVDEWGFDGFVVSDWGASNDHALGIKNGSQLEMPGTGHVGAKAVVAAVKSGRLPEKILDQRLDELLKVIFATHKEGKAKEFSVEEHHEVARRAALESIVLLKNEGDILPLQSGTKVAVIGDFAENPRYQGAGSSLVNPTKLDTTLDNIKKEDIQVISYSKGYERNKPANDKLISEAVQAAKSAQVVLIYAGLDEISESEGMDRTHMRMPQAQDELIEAVAKVNSNVVVVLSAGSVVELPWLSKVKGLVHGYLGGQAGATAMLEVLMGRSCPSGKLNETYPIQYSDVPNCAYFPGKERSSEYREAMYIGYRYYDSRNVKVQFPFGFGLSYTSFEYSDIEATASEVTFTIKNTGRADGAEIAQVYVGKKDSTIFGPKKELKGFKKVFLKAGEQKRVTVKLDDKAFRYYHIKNNKWEIEGGRYEIYVAANVEDVRLEASVEVEGTKAEHPYSREEMRKLAPYFEADVKNIDDTAFEALLSHKIPSGKWNTDGLIEENDAICQIYYAKNPLARFVYKILTGIKDKSEAKGTPNLNVLFIYNMPFRALARMTGGAVNDKMVDAMLEMVNGHGFRGFGHLVGEFFRNSREGRNYRK